MEKGSVVRAWIQQRDGKVKQRPAVLIALFPPFEDWLIAGISSQIRHYVEDFDILLDDQHPDFSTSGLLKPGIIRLGFIGIFSSDDIEGVLGYISTETHIQIIKNLTSHLSKSL